MRFIIFTILGLLLFTGTNICASIVNTKHNLSISNSVVPDVNETIIKAQVETEICVFCHVPHFSQAVGKPLWNRSMPLSNYTMYDSNYLRRLGYPTGEADLGSANDTPGALSRQCLSCHDGTVAVGSVFKLRGTSDVTIPMDGVDSSGYIPSASPTSFGTDLSVHHPVGVVYDTTVSKSFGTGSRTSELLNPPTSPIKLFTYPGYSGSYVECSSCHDPHTQNNKFLHVTAGATLAEDIVLTCTSCHSKEVGGAPNPHKVIGNSYTDGTSAAYGTGVMAKLFCINCHTPHNAQSGQAYLQRKIEQNTCFMGASNDRATAPCHGTGSILERIDIESVLDRPYSHRSVKLADGVHTNLDVLYGTNVTVFPTGTKGLSFADSKHVECVDCHNPHKVGSLNHVNDADIYPTIPTNSVSLTLRGVPGVEPTWPTEWNQPTTFTTLESSTKEYQICLKCHSYWGVGATLTVKNPATGYQSVSDPINVPLTDVAWEMNKNNKSGHPVVVNQLSRTGSYAPKQLDTSQMLIPWKNSPGGYSMYCSDCHGSDNELNVVDPKGPHGSNQLFMLKSSIGDYYWPTKPDGVTLYTMDDIGNAGDTGLFCKNCHDPSYPHTQWSMNMSGKGYTCVTCHMAIPHGSPVSRLIGYNTFPAPYNYGGNSLQMIGWKKRAYNIADLGDNQAAYATHAGGMMGCHGTDYGGYDANLMP